jgi:glycosyltransferase involved in cell wall biosynthesis
MKIPVIINNRDFLTWPKAMVERISRYDNVGDIFIVDNASTYEPLLEWYKTKPCEIIKVDNLGQHAPWISGLAKKLNYYYVVTDADMGLNDTPKDTLNYLKYKMDELNLDKIGLGLNWKIVKEDAIYYNHMQNHERNRWRNTKVERGVAVDIPIDTTFALYRDNYSFIGGASTFEPYVARHYPWEYSLQQIHDDPEFQYYLDHATNASSFKQYFYTKKGS